MKKKRTLKRTRQSKHKSLIYSTAVYRADYAECGSFI